LNQHGSSGISFDFKCTGIPHPGQVIVTIPIALKHRITTRTQVRRFRSALAFYRIAALHLIRILTIGPSNLFGTRTASQYYKENQKKFSHVLLPKNEYTLNCNIDKRQIYLIYSSSKKTSNITLLV
jgi:hypothetical protein